MIVCHLSLYESAELVEPLVGALSALAERQRVIPGQLGQQLPVQLSGRVQLPLQQLQLPAAVRQLLRVAAEQVQQAAERGGGIGRLGRLVRL